jgi:hypothetical protein
VGARLNVSIGLRAFDKFDFVRNGFARVNRLFSGADGAKSIT